MDRRALLTQRLKTLCRRVEQEQNEFPYGIQQVAVFGSFCRPKERPKDVDLALVFTPDQDRHLQFIEFERTILPTVWRVAGNDSIEQWAKRAKLSQKHIRWCSVLSRTNLEQRFGFNSVSPTKVTTRLLKQGLPGIEFVDYPYYSWEELESGLTAGKVFRLWDTEHPDVDENLAVVFSQTNETLLAEYVNFLAQAELGREKIAKVRGQIAAVVASRRSTRSLEPHEFFAASQALYQKFVPEQDIETAAAWMSGAILHDKKAEVSARSVKLEGTELELAVESLRAENKENPAVLRSLADFRDKLIDWKCGVLKTPHYQIEQWKWRTIEDVAEAAWLGLPKRLRAIGKRVIENEVSGLVK